MTTPQNASYAEEQALPDGGPDEVDQETTTEPTGGLVQLGSADGVVCEDGFCWVPPTTPNG